MNFANCTYKLKNESIYFFAIVELSECTSYVVPCRILGELVLFLGLLIWSLIPDWLRNLQNCFTCLAFRKAYPVPKRLNYIITLESLTLELLEYYRLKADLTSCYRIVLGFFDILLGEIFSLLYLIAVAGISFRSLRYVAGQKMFRTVSSFRLHKSRIGFLSLPFMHPTTSDFELLLNRSDVYATTTLYYSIFTRFY